MTIDDKNRDEMLPFDINREAAKISAFSSGKIDKYEWKTNNRALLILLQKRLLKNNKIHRRTRKKQIKAIGGQVNKLVESNELIKKDLNINRDSLRFHEQKNINKLVKEKSYEFNNLKEKINANNFIYEFKTEGRIPKI